MAGKVFRFKTTEEVFKEIEFAKAELDATNRELLLSLIIESDKFDRVDESVLEPYVD